MVLIEAVHDLRSFGHATGRPARPKIAYSTVLTQRNHEQQLQPFRSSEGDLQTLTGIGLGKRVEKTTALGGRS